MKNSTRFEGGFGLLVRGILVALAAGLATAVPIVFWVTWELSVRGFNATNVGFIAWLLVTAVALAALLSSLGGRPISINPDSAREAPLRRRFHLPMRARRSHA